MAFIGENNVFLCKICGRFYTVTKNGCNDSLKKEAIKCYFNRQEFRKAERLFFGGLLQFLLHMFYAGHPFYRTYSR